MVLSSTEGDMGAALGEQRRLVVVAHVDTGDATSLCALWDDGEVIRVAVSSLLTERAIRHAEEHVAAGIDLIQVCSIGCPGPVQ